MKADRRKIRLILRYLKNADIYIPYLQDRITYCNQWNEDGYTPNRIIEEKMYPNESLDNIILESFNWRESSHGSEYWVERNSNMNRFMYNTEKWLTAKHNKMIYGWKD